MATCPKCGTRYASTIRICAHDGTVLDDDGPVNDPHVGKLLDGKYRLDGYLSQGGMGAVYKATHVMLDKTVVVKLIKPELVTSAEIVRRFQREARAASNLNHPNIVSVYDLGQSEDGTLYIAMEFIDGPSLKDVIRKTGPLPVARIKAILAQVASALGEAHSHNIIHRDLKPHNVMLAKGPGGVEIAKLLDFGIAKTFEEGSTQLTQTGFAIGTPQYMAPEQAAGKDVTPQSDLYSLGIILYEMLTGEVPFDAPTTAAILIKQLTEAPQPPSRRNPNVGVSEVLEAITLRCLDKEPTQRFSSADAFAQALKNADGDATRRRVSEAQTHAAPIPSRSATTVGGAVVSAPMGGMTAPTRNVSPVPSPATTATSAPPPIPTALASQTPAPIVTPTAPAPIPAAAPPVAVSAVPPSAGTRPTVPGSAMPAVTVPPAPAASSKTGLWITLAAVAVLVMAVAAVQLGVIPNGQGSSDPAASSTQPASAPLASPASADAPAIAAKPAPAPAAQQAEAPPPSTPASGSSLAPAPAAAATPGTTARSTAPATPSAASVPAVSPASAPAAARTAPAVPPAGPAPASAAAARSSAAPAAAGRSASAPAPAPAAAARPEHPSVFFRCAGDQSVCGTLRSTMLASLEKGDMPVARDAARANVLLSASVEVLQDRVSRDFGTTFATRTYSVEVSGETKDGQAISMPAPKTFSFDAQFGRERLDENARVIASDVVDKVRAYWNK